MLNVFLSAFSKVCTSFLRYLIYRILQNNSKNLLNMYYGLFKMILRVLRISIQNSPEQGFWIALSEFFETIFFWTIHFFRPIFEILGKKISEIPQNYSRNSWEHFSEFLGTVLEILETILRIYRKFAWNFSELFSEFFGNILGILRNYSRNSSELFSKCSEFFRTVCGILWIICIGIVGIVASFRE